MAKLSKDNSSKTSITNFFKPIPSPNLPSSPQSSRRLQTSLPILLSSPRRPPSPRTPPSSPPMPKSRDAIIPASDDEDSDGSLAPLESLLATRQAYSTVPTPQVDRQNPCLTPKAKRSALGSTAGMAALRTEFQFKSLLSDAQRDSATEESFRRVSAMHKEEHGRPITPEARTTKVLREQLAHVVGDDEDQSLDKVVRAVERTDALVHRKRWHFFTDELSNMPRQRFPRKEIHDICGMGHVRKPADINFGVLYMALNLRTLTDDLFLWVLRELVVEKSCRLRREYRRLITLHPDHVDRLITPSLVDELFRTLGATADLADFTTKLRPGDGHGLRYLARDWKHLQSLLDLFKSISPHLGKEARQHCSKILIRMGVDSELLHNPHILKSYHDAVESLVNSVPAIKWDSFCEEICSSILTSFGDPSLRMQTLYSIPSTNKKLHDLRRRIAATCFFNNLSLARRHPDEGVTIQDIHKRLQDDEFKIGPQTDYINLKSLVSLMDTALDVGSRPRDDDPARNGELDIKFDNEVDGLISTLKEKARSINDTGMRSLFPTEAKGELEWVKGRLACCIRSKHRPKKDVFELANQRKTHLDASLSTQQEYMKNFLKSKPTAPSLAAGGRDVRL